MIYETENIPVDQSFAGCPGNSSQYLPMNIKFIIHYTRLK